MGRYDYDDKILKDASAPVYADRLPSGNFGPGGIQYWCAKLGFTVRECVALIGGGHTLGG